MFECFLLSYRSEKLKPFWLLLSDEDLSTLHNLSTALFSREQTTEYRDAVTAALDIKECKVVPFFGGFLKDLRYNLMSSPSMVVLPSDTDHSLEVCQIILSLRAFNPLWKGNP